jgi:hypothetical protein
MHRLAERVCSLSSVPDACARSSVHALVTLARARRRHPAVDSAAWSSRVCTAAAPSLAHPGERLLHSAQLDKVRKDHV